MQRVDSTCGDGDIQRRIGEYLRKVLSAAAQGGDLSGYNECVPARLSSTRGLFGLAATTRAAAALDWTRNPEAQVAV
jgi:hypothetical protein